MQDLYLHGHPPVNLLPRPERGFVELTILFFILDGTEHGMLFMVTDDGKRTDLMCQHIIQDGMLGDTIILRNIL